MIDFIKLSLSQHTAKKLINNKLLKFTHKVSDETGEILYSQASYQKLKFKIYQSGYCEVRGSLHYYFNKGKHNYNNFTYTHLLWVLSDLKQKFEIEEGVIKNLETGINITLTFSPSLILNGLLFHIGKPFYQPIDKPYKECSHQRLYIKCYDKGKQFGLEENILRFELKYVKMEDLNPLGISYLSDLADKEKLTKLKDLLLRYWSQILFYDYSLNLDNFPTTQQNKLLQYQNISFWENITTEQRKYHKRVLNMHINDFSNDLYHTLIYENINQKFSLLLRL